ncbi:MAG: glycosyltransferase family 1 protein [Candidatus Moranbacteria bacterium]|nr:glycosyltransferase family 1 protein [Candidatus Moranbacteria bacterium]
MKIGINASFARKPNTGIGQVTINFLKKLIELTTHNSQLTTLEFILYLEEDLPKEIKLPGNWEKRIFLPAYKRDDLVRKIWWEKFLLLKKVREDECDVFLSLYQSATLLPNMVKHIMVVHDIIPKLFPEYLNNSRKRLYWKLTEKAIRKADKIIAVSHRTEKDLVQHLGIDPAKITVSHIDVDEIYKKRVSEEKNKKVLKKYKLNPGYIYSGGGLEMRKNIERVIRAYKTLLDKNKQIHFINELPKLVISGKLMPELAPLATDAEKLIKELNLTQHVKLLDFVPQEDLPALYANAFMFVYPSLYEGFGLPVLEAMNQGTPVIASKVSSLPEIGRDAVLYCHPEDVGDIAMVMKNVLLNRHLRDTLSERGKERAKHFSWEKFGEKVLNIIEEL